jgi:hydroxyacylglutathione hydrolase
LEPELKTRQSARPGSVASNMSVRASTSLATVTRVAPDVKQVSVGAPFRSHVYLIDGPDGVIAFDAGLKGTGAAILAAGGGHLERVILSHAHVDHRGGAAELGAPVYCHADEVADAEGDAGRSYTDFRLIENEQVRELVPRLHAAWDGGPVTIAGTVADGELIADFRVIHIPGHAPGQIALFRESDRLLIAADAIYTLDAETGQAASARVPHPFSNWDTEMARDSIRRLIPLQATAVWPGHSEAVSGENVEHQLKQAAEFGLDHISA